MLQPLWKRDWHFLGVHYRVPVAPGQEESLDSVRPRDDNRTLRVIGLIPSFILVVAGQVLESCWP